MIFSPNDTARFREATERVTKQPGIARPTRICSVCGARGAGMVKKRGTGTSRHNPSVWLCGGCKA